MISAAMVSSFCSCPSDTVEPYRESSALLLARQSGGKVESRTLMGSPRLANSAVVKPGGTTTNPDWRLSPRPCPKPAARIEMAAECSTAPAFGGTFGLTSLELSMNGRSSLSDRGEENVPHFGFVERNASFLGPRSTLGRRRLHRLGLGAGLPYRADDAPAGGAIDHVAQTAEPGLRFDLG